MMQMLPGYTLERLQRTDIDLLFPLYFWYCRMMSDEKAPAQGGGNVVYRGGKAYRKVDPAKADWA